MLTPIMHLISSHAGQNWHTMDPNERTQKTSIVLHWICLWDLRSGRKNRCKYNSELYRGYRMNDHIGTSEYKKRKKDLTLS